MFMKKVTISLFSALILILSGQGIQAQELIKDGSHRNYTITTETNAHYPGGNEALYRYFFEHMEYPEEAKSRSVEGQVTLSFFVLPDSTVSDVRCLRDLGYGTKEEAIRLVKNLKFAPAVQDGRPIKQNMMVPVIFKIYDR